MPTDQSVEVTLSREELYQQVWSQPISRLALNYGISNVGLAKVCRRLKIPTPQRGYWQQLQFGKSVRKIPLPKLPAGEDHKTVRFGVTEAPPESERVLTEVDVLVRAEKLPEHRIVVVDAIETFHPIVE